MDGIFIRVVGMQKEKLTKYISGWTRRSIMFPQNELSGLRLKKLKAKNYGWIMRGQPSAERT